MGTSVRPSDAARLKRESREDLNMAELGLKKKEIDAIEFAFDVYDFKGDNSLWILGIENYKGPKGPKLTHTPTCIRSQKCSGSEKPFVVQPFKYQHLMEKRLVSTVVEK